ncbi:hypothetical protein [Maridesulfovibrio sp.]|uniref:hypothetical protein n=1 Tax=Maridesulfovibrio sp. TaxID=2795000 RepID=UPI0029F53085|nr:hypothetical protein [Maridesulfovibrio sp.]
MKKVKSLIKIGAAAVCFLEGKAVLDRKNKNISSLPKLVKSTSLAGLDNAAIHFSLARANLEAARLLCSAIINDGLDCSWSHGSVVLSSYYHGCELFYKGAIAKKTGGAAKVHRLDQLRDEFKRLYPDDAFVFFENFEVVNLKAGEKPEVKKEEIESAYKLMDQSFRYHLDRADNLWEGIRAFDAQSCLKDIEKSLESYHKLCEAIHQSS